MQEFERPEWGRCLTVGQDVILWPLLCQKRMFEDVSGTAR